MPSTRSAPWPSWCWTRCVLCFLAFARIRHLNRCGVGLGGYAAGRVVSPRDGADHGLGAPRAQDDDPARRAQSASPSIPRTPLVALAYCFIVMQVHDKHTQYVLSAATIPTMGLKSVDQYAKRAFPHVGTSIPFATAQLPVTIASTHVYRRYM